MGIDLHAADEEDVVVPVLHAIKAVARIAIGFRPAHHSPIPGKGGHRQGVQVGHIQARAEKDQFHVWPARQVGQAHGSLDHRHGHSDAQHFAVLEVARQDHSHQFLGRMVSVWHRTFLQKILLRSALPPLPKGD